MKLLEIDSAYESEIVFAVKNEGAIMFLTKRWIAVLVLMASSAFAGDFEDAQAAYRNKDFDTAVRLLRPLAEQGQPRAQYGLGLMMLNGQGLKRDVSDALRLITIGAEANIPEAQALLALVNYEGTIVPRNYEVATQWAQKSADQGNPIGQTLLGIAYLNGQGLQQDNTQALALLKNSIEKSSNPIAKYELGKMFLIGRGVERDQIKGEELLRQASPQFGDDIKNDVNRILEKRSELIDWLNGNTRLTCGFTCAGSAGYHGREMKNDFERMKWVELATLTIQVGLKSDLHYFYLGRAAEGVGKIDAAVTYYNLAINPKERGNECAGIFNNCHGFEFPRDAKDRLNYAIQSLFNETEKQRNEAVRRAKAEDERQEAKKIEEIAAAFAQVRQEAELGSKESQYRLASMYFSGTGTVVDIKAGITWLTKAAQQGISMAQYELGERYLSGLLVPKDEALAEMWLRKAAQQGHENAQKSLETLISAKTERAAIAAAEAKERAAAAAAAKERAAAAAKERAAIAAATEKKKEAEREELERKRKLENVTKLKSL